MVIHNGTTAYLTQYGDTYTNIITGSFDASISGGILSLLFTPSQSTATTDRNLSQAIAIQS